MCEKQVADINNMLHAIDEFGATTLGLAAQGPQAYTQFIEARDQIREVVERTLKQYRLVEQ